MLPVFVDLFDTVDCTKKHVICSASVSVWKYNGKWCQILWSYGLKNHKTSHTVS